MISKDRNQASLGANRGDLDVCGVVVHDGANVVKSFREKPVEFSGKNDGITRDDKIVLQTISCQNKLQIQSRVDGPFAQRG